MFNTASSYPELFDVALWQTNILLFPGRGFGVQPFGHGARFFSEKSASKHFSSWDDEAFERRAFREEMEQIRKEHEDIESERDKWRARCKNVTSETETTACAAQKEELRLRQEELHARLHELHEKMKAARNPPDAMSAPPITDSPIKKP